jgi:hypothetical protein
LRRGTYYAHVDQVWRPKAAPYGPPDLFEALRRDKAPAFVGRSVRAVPNALGSDEDSDNGGGGGGGGEAKAKAGLCLEDVYAKTVSHATNTDFEAAVKPAPAPAAAAAASAATAAEADDDDDDREGSSGHPPSASESSVVWQSSSSSSAPAPSYPSEIQDQIWTAELLGDPCIIGTALANLVPRCPDKAALYYDVARCALGIRDGADTRES